MQTCGPQTELADRIHASKYRLPGESFRDAMNRVAAALKDSDEHYHALRAILLDQRFVPGGRIQSAMGSGRQVTAYNCFVSGTIADTMTGGDSSIMGRASEAAETMRRGGGIGYDFSTLRPSGAPIKKLGSTASGPVSFLKVFDAVGVSISSSGHRRGAQMGVLRVDHPDIEEFIRCKQADKSLTGFNLSVAVTDRFMRAVENDDTHQLVFERQVHREIRARDLWEQIMRSTWDWAEPGILFVDRINEMNNLVYCETISATNPCGEQPLPPYGACLLGSFNLPRYLVLDDAGMPVAFDAARLARDVPHVVRAMDNVIDRTSYPLHAQEEEARSKRRMGLGVMGLATALEALGHPYGSDRFLHVMRTILTRLRDRAYEASVELAQEKGSFLAYHRDGHMASRFVATLPVSLQDAIAAHGIRNSHLLSIAPTGTISRTCDFISSGIEPVFALETRRTMALGGQDVEVIEQDYAHRLGWERGKLASDCSADDHLRVLEVATEYVDSAVAKTCNVPASMPWAEFKALYARAWMSGCKGCTTFQTGGKKTALLTAAEGASCTVDPQTGERECA